MPAPQWGRRGGGAFQKTLITRPIRRRGRQPQRTGGNCRPGYSARCLPFHPCLAHRNGILQRAGPAGDGLRTLLGGPTLAGPRSGSAGLATVAKARRRLRALGVRSLKPDGKPSTSAPDTIRCLRQGQLHTRARDPEGPHGAANGGRARRRASPQEPGPRRMEPRARCGGGALPPGVGPIYFGAQGENTGPGPRPFPPIHPGETMHTT